MTPHAILTQRVLRTWLGAQDGYLCQRNLEEIVVDNYVQVVTVFVEHHGQVFVIKRSEKVGSYQGQWGAISGYVEQLPLAQALIELQEETNLSPDDVHLRGIGVPTLVNDLEQGRSWLVYPFLFETEFPERVTTNWEASESRWVTPEELQSLNTVPGLSLVLDKVWPPFGGHKFWNELNRIAVDTTHGALDLALDGLKALAEYTEQTDIHRAALAFASSRPSMGPFPNLAARFLALVKSGYDYKEVIQALRAEIINSTNRSVELAAAKLRGMNRILAHSKSRSVYETILTWAKDVKNPEVVVTESRPKNEGVVLAGNLAEKGLKVTLITDAQMAHFIPTCDAVLVGCDAITPSAEIINKAGTRLAVLAAQAYGVPAFAVAQSFKIVPGGWLVPIEEQNPDDVLNNKSFSVRNVIFDCTLASDFTAVVTENGDLSLPLKTDLLKLDLEL